MLNLLYRWRRIRDAVFTRLMRRELGALGAQSSIKMPVDFRGLASMHFGDSVFIYAGTKLHVGPGASLTIGNRSHIRERGVVSARSSITIGSGCAIGRGVHIADHTYDAHDLDLDVRERTQPEARAIRIGDGTWIAQNVVILPGVTIGRRAVVGAGSVVTRDVPDFGVAVGIPARTVRVYG